MSIFAIITTLLTSEWFWTAVIVPFVLWVLTKIGAKYNKDTVEKSLQILKEIVVLGVSFAEVEAKKGNLQGSKKDFVIKYVMENCPKSVKDAIPNFEKIIPSIIESVLMNEPKKFGFAIFKDKEQEGKIC